MFVFNLLYIKLIRIDIVNIITMINLNEIFNFNFGKTFFMEKKIGGKGDRYS